MGMENFDLQNNMKIVLNPDQKYFDQLQEWISKTDRWNYRKLDYKLWQEAYEKFWLYLAIDEENDKVVSSISLALQKDLEGDALFSIGNFYCVPEWRGKGISGKLFKIVMEIIEDQNATLYSTDLVSDFYVKRANFSIITEFWYMFGEVEVENINLPKYQNQYVCKNIEDTEDWLKLHNYDETICNFMNRKKYISKSMALDDTISKVAYDSGRVVGYGALKFVAGKEIMISPLYADNLEVAVSLLTSLLQSIPTFENHKFLVIIYPEINQLVPELLSTISNNRFKTHKEVRAQYTRKMFKLPYEKIFAVEECSHNPV